MAAIDGLMPGEMTAPINGGWSAKDMLAHLTAWEELMLFDFKRAALGRIVANYCRGTDVWNPILQTGRDVFPLDQVLDELGETREAVMCALDEIADEGFISGDVAGACQIMALHDWQHATDITNWRKRGTSDVS
jgi:hypothetical protein